MQFAITSAKPPTIGTVLLSMDAASGVGVNTSLNVTGNLTVVGVFDCPTIYTKKQSDDKFQHRNPINAMNSWVHLGTLYTAQVGRSATFDINYRRL